MITRRGGFTLIELSIVLVIVGLLAGGILAGQSLIRAAELRNISTDYTRYTTAIYAFRDKYFTLPGDIRNATQFWAYQNAGAGCVNNTGTGIDASKGVCDGNGNGNIDFGAAANQSSEMFQYWRHLMRAGLVEGNYTGIAGPATNADATLSVNVPPSRISNVGWSILYRPIGGADTSMGSNAYREPNVVMNNHYRVGVKNMNNLTAGNFLLPVEMWNLDTKMDDGKPMRGKMLTRFIYGNAAPDPACTDAPFSSIIPSPTDGIGNRAFDANYKNTVEEKVCGILVLFN